MSSSQSELAHKLVWIAALVIANTTKAHTMYFIRLGVSALILFVTLNGVSSLPFQLNPLQQQVSAFFNKREVSDLGDMSDKVKLKLIGLGRRLTRMVNETVPDDEGEKRAVFSMHGHGCG